MVNNYKEGGGGGGGKKDDEEEEFHPLTALPPAPDGGWGWLVAAAATVQLFVLIGFYFTNGVYLKPMIKVYSFKKSH